MVRSFKTLVCKAAGEKIWQRGYYDRIIRNEADYLRIWNYIDVNPARWDSRAEIRLPNADTVSLRDAVIFLRCNDRFAEDTLTVRIATVTPDSLRFGEWFLLVIPHPKGPAALMREAAIPYRRRIRLTQHGDYRCSVTPVRPVRGVEAVGVDLQQSR